MKSNQLRLRVTPILVAAGVVFLASTLTITMNAQVKTQTQVEHGTATHDVKVERGEVLRVEGNDLFVKMDDGQLRHFPNVSDTVTVKVDGKDLTIHELKPGMKLERVTVTSSTPRMVTTVQSVTGKVWNINPPSSVILTLEDGTNQSFKIPKGQKFMVDGQQVDAWGIKKGMKISATRIVETPETVVSREVTRTGSLPPPPPAPPADVPMLIVEVKAPAPVEVAAAEPAPANLPKTGSSLPLIGLLGLLSSGASFGIRMLRRS
jgi:LPXTG-motif cell wall-anchored protein